MTPQRNSNIPTERQLGQAISSDAQKAKVFYYIRTKSQFNDSSVFLKELQFWEHIKENTLDTLIASSVLKDQKGNQLSHTLNRLQHQNTHQHKAAAPAAHQLLSVVFVQSAAEKSLFEEIVQEGIHKRIQLAFQPEFITHCSWGQENQYFIFF